MRRKSDYENYLCLDHTHAGASQPDEHVIRAGLPAGAGRGKFETALISCNHCRKQVAVNSTRMRPRHWCRHCDRYICDECAAVLYATGICRPWAQVREEAAEAAIRGIAYKPPEGFNL